MDAGGYCWEGNDLLLRVRAQPRASRDEWAGLQNDRFRVRITALPVDGRANIHLRAFLAELFGVAKIRSPCWPAKPAATSAGVSPHPSSYRRA